MAPMTVNASPGGSSDVDSITSDRISDMNRAMSDGFRRVSDDSKRIEAQFDKVVTRVEFSATVQRLEGQDKAIEEKVDRGLARVSEQVADGFKAAADETKERNAKNRWLWGAGAAVIGVINAVVFNLVALFAK